MPDRTCAGCSAAFVVLNVPGHLRRKYCFECRPPQGEAPCSVCGTPLVVNYQSAPKPVCHPCRRTLVREQPPAKRRVIDCEVCGVAFPAIRTDQKFCSTRCRGRMRCYPMRPCRQCGYVFAPTKNSGPDTNLCSRYCTHMAARVRPEANRPKITSSPLNWASCLHCREQWIARLSKTGTHTSACAHKLRYIPKSVRRCRCGSITPSMGRPRGPWSCPMCKAEARRRAWQQKNDRGSNHRQRARYYGVEYKPFSARLIFERDGWQCYICDRTVDPTHHTTIHYNRHSTT